VLETLLQLSSYFEPATSAEILAVVGAVTLAILFVVSMYRAGRAASEGMGHIAAALGRLLQAIGGLIIALGILWLTICLVRAALVYLLQ